MKRKALIAGAVLVVVLLGLFVYFVRLGEAPEGCTFKLDTTAMRAAANAMPGDKPTAIRAERLTTFRFPRALIAAGESFAMANMDVFAYQLAFPAQTHVIDTGMSESMATANNGKDYSPAAWKWLSQAMNDAQAIYVTHEHSDHIGGLIASGDAVVWKKAQLQPEQREPGKRLQGMTMPAEATAAFGHLDYEGMTTVAPGVVAIRVPGHTPGSQMFFVQRDDGRELLIIGDTAWQGFSIDEVRNPPNLIKLMPGTDPHANVCQIAALNALQKSDPKIALMPGHDRLRMAQLVKEGLVVKLFE